MSDIIPERYSEIALDVAIRLYTVRRPLQPKVIAQDLDHELLGICVDDARDLVDGLLGATRQPPH